MTQLVLARQSVGTEEDEQFSDERLINMHVRAWPDVATSQMLIKQTDGLTTFSDTGTRTPIRALLKGVSTLYAVSGARLWSITSAGVATELGTVDDAVNTTLFENDNGHIGIATAGNYYQYDPSGPTMSSAISMNALTSVQQVAYLDGYGILADTAADRFQLTDLNDADALTATFFSSADALPDGLVAVVAYQSFVWLFGESSTEVWRNVGNSDFPFQRMSGAVIERGCFAPKSVATDEEGVYFVGSDKVVYQIQGTQAVRISTHAVERMLENYTQGSNIVGFTWTESGHKFYALRFDDRPAWVYDVSMQIWHERSSCSSIGAAPWVGTCSEKAFGRQLIGGRDGKIYQTSPSSFLECGSTMVRLIQTPPIVRGMARTVLKTVKINCRTGAVDIDREPQVAMQVSRDGKSWTPEKWRGMGDLGDYDRVLSWHGLGQARRHQLRFKLTDPVPWSVYGGVFELA
jgi:hypothetical protein